MSITRKLRLCVPSAVGVMVTETRTTTTTKTPPKIRLASKVRPQSAFAVCTLQRCRHRQIQVQTSVIIIICLRCVLCSLFGFRISAQFIDRSYQLIFPRQFFIFGGIIRWQVRNRCTELFEKSTSPIESVTIDVGFSIRPSYFIRFERLFLD